MVEYGDYASLGGVGTLVAHRKSLSRAYVSASAERCVLRSTLFVAIAEVAPAALDDLRELVDLRDDPSVDMMLRSWATKWHLGPEHFSGPLDGEGDPDQEASWVLYRARVTLDAWAKGLSIPFSFPATSYGPPISESERKFESEWKYAAGESLGAFKTRATAELEQFIRDLERTLMAHGSWGPSLEKEDPDRDLEILVRFHVLGIDKAQLLDANADPDDPFSLKMRELGLAGVDKALQRLAKPMGLILRRDKSG